MATRNTLKACLLLTTSTTSLLFAHASSASTQAAAAGGDFSDMISQFIPHVSDSATKSEAKAEVSTPRDCLQSPELCKSKADLDSWKQATLADLQQAPEAVRGMVQAGIESKYAKRLSELSDGVAQAANDLDTWKNEQLEQISKLQTSAQAQALALLDKEVQRRREALASSPSPKSPSQAVAPPPPPRMTAPEVAPQGLAATEQPPACLLRAEACNSERELRAWRVTKLTWIREQVPSDRQAAEVEGVRADYDKRRAELLRTAQARSGNRSEATPAPPSGATAVIAAAEASSPESVTRLSSTFMYCAAALMLPALMAGLAAAMKKPAKEGRNKRPEMYQEELYMALEEAGR
mmetsp:Transcript_57131/g.121444  ORF Transcript_57131/g.121444 Transcript_57131/m.121444 type:complete len:351 (-) Transcript_57131:668-1720(-)|eukprot:CAMPEP_0206489072 /NCGR_PEP_ID=MMETSP0324_2-20121206/42911_1 /ASSEMBLY_ACC=CAM_ASM_000836 /TAXON_ID=2866 /ORGANISM="Crypthecodinium cohnii, Strain Seligo" /LENGTH=350 /DNA_ID=CAMNT_0053968459 /DNA_START=197 /DNA_END=1249 /DNA_ORIENTATION=-